MAGVHIATWRHGRSCCLGKVSTYSEIACIRHQTSGQESYLYGRIVPSGMLMHSSVPAWPNRRSMPERFCTMMTTPGSWASSHACESPPACASELLSNFVEAPLGVASLLTGCCDGFRESSTLLTRGRKACSLHSLSLIPRGPAGALRIVSRVVYQCCKMLPIPDE